MRWVRGITAAAIVTIAVGGAVAAPAAHAARSVTRSSAATSVTGDIDGDGHSDLVVGEDSGITVTYTSASPGGSHTQLIPLPAGSLTDAGAYGALNVVVGDFNGDGYADVAAGSPAAAKGDGEVFVWYGSATGLDPSKVVAIHGPTGSKDGFGGALVAADLNVGKDADLLVSDTTGVDGRTDKDVTLLFGSSTGLTTKKSRVFDIPNLVSAVIGDVNGDGYPDLIVAQSAPSRVSIFHGTKRGISSHRHTIAGLPRTSGSELGSSMAIGKVNGDSYPDVVLGDSEAKVGGEFAAGRVVVLFGGKQGLTSAHDAIVSLATKGVPGAPSKYDEFGAVVTVGDVNGDGRGDLLIGTARSSTNKVGEFYVIRGTATSITGVHSQQFLESTAGVPGAPGANSDYFGSTIVAFHPDGRKYASVAVGAPGDDFVDVFKGSASGLTTTGAQQLTGTSPDNFGEVLAP